MIGTTIGDYRILEKRGEGGMGMFFKAQDIRLERIVGLKTIRAELLHDPDVLGKLEEEAKSLARLDHPNIARLLHYMVTEDQRYIVMEYVDGADLAVRLRKNGPMSLAEMARLVPQICAAIGYAHNRNVIHRDIKPSNILLTEDGTAKVTDFGIAKVLGVSSKTKTGVATGSLPYMAPEQIRGTGVDARTDIYQLGVMFFELLAGRRPFVAETEYDMMSHHLSTTPPAPSSLNPGIPRELDRVLLKALSKSPQDRFASAEELSMAFRAAAGTADDSRTVFARPGTTGADARPRMRQGLKGRLLYVSGALVIALAATWMYWARTDDDPRRKVTVTAGLPVGGVPENAGSIRLETTIEYRAKDRKKRIYDEGGNLLGKHKLAVPANHTMQPGTGSSVTVYLNPADSISFRVMVWTLTDTGAILEGGSILDISAADSTPVHLTVPLHVTEYAARKRDTTGDLPAQTEDRHSDVDDHQSPASPSVSPDTSRAMPAPQQANLTLDVQPFTERERVEAVWIDGKRYSGAFPIAITAPKGRRQVRWRIGNDYWTDTVTVGDVAAEKSLIYETSRGRINITASFSDGPGFAEIILDGQETGQGTPGELRDVASGPHQITLRRDGYRMQGDPIIIRVSANDRVRINIPMVPVAPPN